jgi:DNA-binding MarR family transcriptional regulator
LPTLLSQALVAFTIEFDNEFERQMPHRTTKHRLGAGPWLVSMAMWFNCMRFVGDAGVTASELEALAGTKTNLNGMERWGYVVVAPDPADTRPNPPRSRWLIRATAKGLAAREVWRPLFGAIEKRWEERFGKRDIDQLRESLKTLIGQIGLKLPDCLPILGYGLYSSGPHRVRRTPAGRDVGTDSGPTLPALLSKVLLAFAIEFERESALSLAIGANLLRVLDEKGVRIRDLPLLTGVSKQAIGMAMGILRKRSLAVEEPERMGSRVKVARLTPMGRAAQDAYRQLLAVVEKRWRARFGKDAIGALRNSLERLAGEPAQSPLFRGLEPYPDGWRASVRKPNTLPHYPMVLHRGGYPDGS